MTGAVKRRTNNFGFNIINYDFPRWHTYDWQNWDVVDAVLAAANLTSVRGIWENARSKRLINISSVIPQELVNSM